MNFLALEYLTWTSSSKECLFLPDYERSRRVPTGQLGDSAQCRTPSWTGRGSKNGDRIGFFIDEVPNDATDADAVNEESMPAPTTACGGNSEQALKIKRRRGWRDCRRIWQCAAASEGGMTRMASTSLTRMCCAYDGLRRVGTTRRTATWMTRLWRRLWRFEAMNALDVDVDDESVLAPMTVCCGDWVEWTQTSSAAVSRRRRRAAGSEGVDDDPQAGNDDVESSASAMTNFGRDDDVDELYIMGSNLTSSSFLLYLRLVASS